MTSTVILLVKQNNFFKKVNFLTSLEALLLELLISTKQTLHKMHEYQLVNFKPWTNNSFDIYLYHSISSNETQKYIRH